MNCQTLLSTLTKTLVALCPVSVLSLPSHLSEIWGHDNSAHTCLGLEAPAGEGGERAAASVER